MYFVNIQQCASKQLSNTTSHYISNHSVCDDTYSWRNHGHTAGGGIEDRCVCIEISHCHKPFQTWETIPTHTH